MISLAIKKVKGIKIGLCGQAPSDFPKFASFLVDEGIDSISYNPDVLFKGIENITISEKVKNVKIGEGVVLILFSLALTNLLEVCQVSPFVHLTFQGILFRVQLQKRIYTMQG